MAEEKTQIRLFEEQKFVQYGMPKKKNGIFRWWMLLQY